MKTKIFSKKLLVTLSIVLIAVMALCIAGCTSNQDEPTTTEPVQTTDSQSSVIEKGAGKTSFSFTVTDSAGKETEFLIRTDKTIVGEALLDAGLIAGENGPYGLYVKTVNGITLDYDKDQKYWAFYENGNYASAGVDQTEIKDGVVYSFKAEK